MKDGEIYYSPIDVLKIKKKKQKYADETKRIKEADLNYPIIIYKNYVVDGVYID
jgi:hypothetical protein